MKKQQFKGNNNIKSRLLINRSNNQNLEVTKSTASQFNTPVHISIVQQLKKEEKIRQNCLPFLQHISKPQPLSLHQEVQSQTHQIKKISHSQSKPSRLSKRKSSFDCTQKNSKKQSMQLFVIQFIKILERKKFIYPHYSSFMISQDKLEIIFMFLINTRLNKKGKKNSIFQQLSEEHQFEEFMQKYQRNELQIQEDMRLTLCSGTHWSSIMSDWRQRNIEELKNENQSLLVELKERKEIKQSLIEATQKKNQQFQTNVKNLQKIENQIKEAHNQLAKLKANINQNRKVLIKLQTQRLQIQNFVHLQPNKIVEQAAEYHKNLQLDMFQFADFLKYHPMGKRQFQKSIYFIQIQRVMSIDLKQMNRFLIQESGVSIDQKNKCMRDFLLKLNHQYTLIIEELTHAIDEKTKFIRKFTAFIDKWYQNYLTKKEYLSNLRLNFAFEVDKYQCVREQMAGFGLLSKEQKELTEIVDNIIQIYKIGNSFY